MKFSDYKKLRINGLLLEDSEILDFCRSHKEKNVRALGRFMEAWLDENSYVEVQTSGSTGKSKIVKIEKNNMLQSAARTIDFFDLKEGDTVLLCLSIDYIAGKMMTVRALLGGLNLYLMEPCSNPIERLPRDKVIDFAPLVPLQLVDVEDTKLIKKILLGGSAVDPVLEEKVQTYKACVYHGYGMTETLSHIAVRSVNKDSKSIIYDALPGVVFELDFRGCLGIRVPFLEQKVQTNDIVELVDKTSFRWKGRIDFVVNSGGVKLSPETIESKIAPLLEQNFFLAGIPDKKFGEQLCLFIEGEPYSSEEYKTLLNRISIKVTCYERPKSIYFVDQFERTSTKKIQRRKTIQKALEHIAR